MRMGQGVRRAWRSAAVQVPMIFEPRDIRLLTGPGDSRTPHYNVPAKGTQDRLAVYTCYMPVADASQEDLIRKKAAWEGELMIQPTSDTFMLTSGSQGRNHALAQRAAHWHERGQAKRCSGQCREDEAAERAAAEREGVQADGCAVHQGLSAAVAMYHCRQCRVTRSWNQGITGRCEWMSRTRIKARNVS
jgi:hypothetical protein